MKGASSAMLVLLLAGGVITYLTMDKIGYTPPSTFSEEADPEDPSNIPNSEVNQPIQVQEKEEIDLASVMPEQPAIDQEQQALVEGQSQLKADRAALDVERQIVEQERQRLTSWEEELTQQSVWLQQAQQNLLDTQLELDNKRRELTGSIARLESLQTLFKARLLVLEKEREQMRQDEERLVWLQVGTLVLADLILIIEITRYRRPIILWLRARRIRSASPNRKLAT